MGICFWRIMNMKIIGLASALLLSPIFAQAADPWPEPSLEIIARAQQQLRHQGYAVGGSDGIMEPETQSALRQFQSDNNLRQSGRLDQETQWALGLAANYAAR
jgi:peptidoglycan hydrolase-like protein with peptidoglycan-binding domain